jgi:hypothetical protein
MLESTKEHSGETIHVLVFFGLHRDLSDAVHHMVESHPETRFVCVLRPDGDAAKVKWFWEGQVAGQFPAATLLVLHETDRRAPQTLADLASVLHEQSPGTNVKLVLLSRATARWAALREARWLRLLRKTLSRQVPDCTVVHFA